MIDRLKSKTAVATVASLVAALGVGGVALAQNGSSTPSQKAQSAPAKVTPAKKESEVPGQEANTADKSALDADNVQAGDGEQSGSEVPGNDGPGGHADEPGNPNADHQEAGQE
jgi:hypothetical protein